MKGLSLDEIAAHKLFLTPVLHSADGGAGFATMLGTLYAALYGLLVSEDNALVLGSGLLFVILAMVMLVTRRVDWYQLGGGSRSMSIQDDSGRHARVRPEN